MESHNEVRLTPLSDESQTCLSFRLVVEPAAKLFSYDEIGGSVMHFDIRNPHSQLDVVAISEVRTHAFNPMTGLNFLEDDWAYYDSGDAYRQFSEYLTPSPYVQLNDTTRTIANRIKGRELGADEGPSVAQYLIALSHFVHESFSYDRDVTHVHSTVEDVLEERAGVCQDFSHVMIACCRSIGIPARYVSGYLHGDDASALRGDGAMHAWVDCLMPSGKWVAFDPTNNLLADDRYIRVHVGRDYSDVAPIKGVYVGVPADELEISITVLTVQD